MAGWLKSCEARRQASKEVPSDLVDTSDSEQFAEVPSDKVDEPGAEQVDIKVKKKKAPPLATNPPGVTPQTYSGECKLVKSGARQFESTTLIARKPSPPPEPVKHDTRQ